MIASPEDMHAVVLAGGLTPEREVSQWSGRRVARSLGALGVEVSLLDADSRLLLTLGALRADAVFIALHGSSGEDGALREVLELIDMPYVGARAAACRMAWDKPNTKAMVRAAGLRTPEWVALPQSAFRELGTTRILERIVATLGLPLMVKPAQGGSALGARRVRDAADLPGAMVDCFAYGETVLVERYVDGVEVAVSVLDGVDGPRALPAVEIVPSGGVFDYAARYTAGMTTYHTPARLDPDVAARAADMAREAHRVMGLRDLSRTDAIITPAGEVMFLEVNVAPGMTDTSMTPMAIDAAGLELGPVCADLLLTAIRRGT